MTKKISAKRSDKPASIQLLTDVTAMEPMLISVNSKYRKELTDLTIELAAKSAGFRRSLPQAMQSSLSSAVRTMNCYYSNLIEGHNTHPIDIEAALHGNYSTDEKKRNLQLEAKAHIAVQEWIDQGALTQDIFSEKTICEIHKRFCELLPDDLLWVQDPRTHTKIKVEPGKFRENDVQVGNHIGVNHQHISAFLKRFEDVYNHLGKAETILSLAASHHRLLWIHPFLDGNGRVPRMISHAATMVSLENGGMWSIARGLARNVNEYKTLLANCDLQRRNDLDGRGNLSEEALVDFTRFFLNVCIDQINFMENLMQPNLLRTRILLWAKEEISAGNLPPQAANLLEAVLYQGEIIRGDLPKILDLSERHARRVSSILVEKGILISDTPKSSLKLAFPARLAARWMPGLFPEK